MAILLVHGLTYEKWAWLILLINVSNDTKIHPLDLQTRYISTC